MTQIMPRPITCHHTASIGQAEFFLNVSGPNAGIRAMQAARPESRHSKIKLNQSIYLRTVSRPAARPERTNGAGPGLLTATLRYLSRLTDCSSRWP
ncbi:MAG: hypothetical protein E6447_22025, partial [Bradyrhizobium sp.]|nr:hypothetical protein [Bradyrhizobium sp.]